MKENVDYNLLIAAERIRYTSDFSSAHWLHQVISNYERGLRPRIAEAYETVLRIAINSSVKLAMEKANEYPDICGFPQYLKLEAERWGETQEWIQNNFELHLKNRFGYLRDGD